MKIIVTLAWKKAQLLKECERSKKQSCRGCIFVMECGGKKDWLGQMIEVEEMR